MMGFAGQLSLGHALYVGLGAYAAAALYVHFGVSPWIGLWLSMAVSAAAGAVIGYLAFRFGVAGVYFAILTIAFAEFARIGFDHWRWLGRLGRVLSPRRQLHAQRHPEPARQPHHVLLPGARHDGCGLRPVPRAAAQPRRLLLAGHPREPRGRAGAGHRHVPLQDVRGGGVGGHDLARRRAVRLLLQQPVPRAGLPHLALHRADPGAHHRRHRHAVRPDRRRFPAHRAGRDAGRDHARLRHRHPRRQAGVLRLLPAARRHVPARRHLAAAEPGAGIASHARPRATRADDDRAARARARVQELQRPARRAGCQLRRARGPDRRR